MKKLFFILFPCFLMMTNVSTGQSVDNITSEIKDGMVIIHYSLGGKFYQIFNVSIYVSRDGGNNFIGPLKEVTGDVGLNIKRGNKSVTWDVIKEMPIVEETLVFDVRAEVTGEKPKSSVFVQYVGNFTTYMGLRVGMLKILGFYGEVRANTSAFRSAPYTYSNGTVNYDGSGYYMYTGENGYSAFSALAGLTWQPARNFYLYLGGGYGWENYQMGIDTYSYDGDVKTGSSYVLYDGYNNSGLEVDLGMMLRIKWFLLSVGATELNFKSFNFTVGLGAAF